VKNWNGKDILFGTYNGESDATSYKTAEDVDNFLASMESEDVVIWLRKYLLTKTYNLTVLISRKENGVLGGGALVLQALTSFLEDILQCEELRK